MKYQLSNEDTKLCKEDTKLCSGDTMDCSEHTSFAMKYQLCNVIPSFAGEIPWVVVNILALQ